MRALDLKPLGKRRTGGHRALLEELWQSIPTLCIIETQIPHPTEVRFGEHDSGTVRLNVPLLRVLVFIHEALHARRPRWSERTVRARTTQIIQGLSDDEIQRLNERLVAGDPATKPRGGRART